MNFCDGKLNHGWFTGESALFSDYSVNLLFFLNSVYLSFISDFFFFFFLRGVRVPSVPLLQVLQYKNAKRAIICLQTPDISVIQPRSRTRLQAESRAPSCGCYFEAPVELLRSGSLTKTIHLFTRITDLVW